jgi:hypothetical protein
MTIQFDTLRYVEKLKSAGMPEAHAKASAEALSTALEQSISSTLATKEDIYAVKSAINEIKVDIKDFRHSVKQDCSTLRNDMNLMKAEIQSAFQSYTSQLRADMKVMQWMLGTIVVGVVSLVAKSFF